MVGDAWLRGGVPTVYAKQTLQKAQQELQKEIDTLKPNSQNQAKLQTQILLSAFN